MKDVILFLKYNFHKAGMIPISKQLTKLNIEHEVHSKRHIIYDHFNETKKKFKIFVIGDEWGNLFRDCSENLITIGHSMANKNTTMDRKNSEMDYICVPSMYYKGEFLRRGISPKKDFLITGFPYADRIFNKEIDEDIYIFQKFNKNNKKNILICPTYNRDLNLVDEFIRSEKEESVLKDFFYNNPDAKIIFKPHPVLPKKYPDQMNYVKSLINVYSENFYYHEDSHDDIADFINWSSIIVGDCSGSILLGAASDKPIFAYDNPNKERSEYFDPEGIEWTFRDLFSTRFFVINKGFFEHILEELNNDNKKESRLSLVNLLYGEYQGNSSLQVANYISDFYRSL